VETNGSWFPGTKKRSKHSKLDPLGLAANETSNAFKTPRVHLELIQAKQTQIEETIFNTAPALVTDASAPPARTTSHCQVLQGFKLRRDLCDICQLQWS